ncbi:MAG: gamma-glutamyl-gamma-aminobutyrate hydrolase family protein [Burkholderiaceae bacterium]
MRTEPSRRLALTMRVASAADYDEPRDCLAQDWSRFLVDTLPAAAWMGLPNDPSRTGALLEAWGVDGLILTGGNDIGENPRKDAADLAALDHAVRTGMPVLAVCRGLQLLQHRFGGALSPIADRSHVALEHDIECEPDTLLNPTSRRATLRVNSYHDNAIRGDGLAHGLEPIARAGDGSIEAVTVPGRRIVGVMWHPERSPTIAAADRRIVEALFGGRWQWR